MSQIYWGAHDFLVAITFENKYISRSGDETAATSPCILAMATVSKRPKNGSQGKICIMDPVLRDNLGWGKHPDSHFIGV
jgi:hypothetical protein